MSLLLELAFQDAQRLFNSLYYQQGARYASDFSTYASQGRLLAYSEAESFHAMVLKRFQSRLPSTLRILELGCGNGNNAYRFLERLKQLDKKKGTDLLKRTHYVLSDFSENMLKDAIANRGLSQYAENLAFAAVDAESQFPNEGDFLLIRANELFDDLPTQLIVREGGAFKEIWLELHLNSSEEILTRDGEPIPRSEFAWLARNRFQKLISTVVGSFVKRLELVVKYKPVKLDTTAFMILHSAFGRIPEGEIIPIPFGAASCIAAARSTLVSGGIFNSFDYGFNSLKGLHALQPGIFRMPGALTTFVNFSFLKSLAPLFGYAKAIVEPQRKFTGGREGKEFYHLRLQA